ncbi:hypothetical protein Illi2_00202 [Pseudomonas phage vB_PpuM-Illi-2]
MKTEQEMQRAKISQSMAALLNDAVGGSIGSSLRDLGNATMGKPEAAHEGGMSAAMRQEKESLEKFGDNYLTMMSRPKHKRKVMNRAITRVNAIVSKHGVCPKVLAPVRFVSSKTDVFKLAKIKLIKA